MFRSRSFWDKGRETLFIKMLFGERRINYLAKTTGFDLDEAVQNFDFYLKSYTDDKVDCDSNDDIDVKEMNHILALSFGKNVRVKSASFYDI